ncbi:hypothetical protein [Moritella sp. F3]|uniref:hypothetical protein n=1 Tax=Moritella sp. F3 TaxID=2718882 RepID=UPI0018E14FF1|nr:hypothetical protein [Moritella sp. F3]GIC77663.1 hypothetical protein FMO001_23900 [Moritella sp. F1]GIC82076.1 hypothetical protein FMO003_23570 [Moritella sp. F3]
MKKYLSVPLILGSATIFLIVAIFFVKLGANLQKNTQVKDVPEIAIDVEAFEVQLYDFTISIKKGCTFNGYKKDIAYTKFFAQCGNRITEIKIDHENFVIQSFGVDESALQDEPIKLSGVNLGVDFEKVLSEYKS